MREIKVRAWDEVEKRFWTLRDGGETSGEGSVQYYGNEQGVLEIGRLEEFDVGDMWSSQFTVFPSNQFTGLKDKNGQEIYEGDIIEFYDFWDEISGGNMKGKTRVGVVKYLGTGFQVTDNNSYESDLYLLKMNDDELKIVGNIHENADLLEVEE